MGHVERVSATEQAAAWTYRWRNMGATTSAWPERSETAVQTCNRSAHFGSACESACFCLFLRGAHSRHAGRQATAMATR
jgi:hypothetical protein